MILAALDSEGFEGLSETAAEVWRLLDVPRSAPQVAEILGRSYEAPPDTIGEDVERLLGDLVRRGFVVSVGERG